jgi:hypothetical protein
MGVTVSGVVETKKALATLAGQLPYATSLALNRTGNVVLAAQREEMRRSFDRPTPYTLNALFQTKARKDNLETRTRIKSPSLAEAGQTEKRYVGVQIFGGDRKDKASERILRQRGLLPAGYQMVPGGGIKLDEYGNVPGGTVQAILKALLADYTGGRVKATRGTFVIGQVGGTQGIWKVQRNKWLPMFIFVRKPSYQRRLDYYGVSERTFARNWSEIFGKAVDDAIRTAR